MEYHQPDQLHQKSQPEWYDPSKNPIEVKLRHRGFDFSLNCEPVLARDAAVEQYGINGDILAVITLPKGDDGTEKQLAVIDHGEHIKDQPAVIVEGRGMGSIDSRYALFGLNYSPKSHIYPYAPLEGESTSIGKGEQTAQSDVNEHVSYQVGLYEQQGNEAVSRNHFTIKIGEDLRIFDHSTNGTKVFVNDRERTAVSEPKELHREATDTKEAQLQQPEQDTTAESRHTTRLKKLFKPFIRPENPVKDPGFNHLFSDDPEVKKRHEEYRVEVEKVRPAQQDYDRYVNEDTRRAASEYLTLVLRYDRGLADIIEGFSGKVDVSKSLEIVDALRTDSDLRLAVGSYLLDKEERILKEDPGVFPERIRDDTQKSPDHHDYRVKRYEVGNMTSREYAALVALALIDGSFNGQKVTDSIEYNEKGVATQGQHRAAAYTILNTVI